jgi:hypothetical protein
MLALLTCLMLGQAACCASNHQGQTLHAMHPAADLSQAVPHSG